MHELSHEPLPRINNNLIKIIDTQHTLRTIHALVHPPLVLEAFSLEQRIGRHYHTLVRRVFDQKFSDFLLEVELYLENRETTFFDETIGRIAEIVVVVDGTRDLDRVAAR